MFLSGSVERQTSALSRQLLDFHTGLLLVLSFAWHLVYCGFCEKAGMWESQPDYAKYGEPAYGLLLALSFAWHLVHCGPRCYACLLLYAQLCRRQANSVNAGDNGSHDSAPTASKLTYPEWLPWQVCRLQNK